MIYFGETKEVVITRHRHASCGDTVIVSVARLVGCGQASFVGWRNTNPVLRDSQYGSAAFVYFPICSDGYYYLKRRLRIGFRKYLLTNNAYRFNSRVTIASALRRPKVGIFVRALISGARDTPATAPLMAEPVKTRVPCRGPVIAGSADVGSADEPRPLTGGHCPCKKPRNRRTPETKRRRTHRASAKAPVACAAERVWWKDSLARSAGARAACCRESAGGEPLPGSGCARGTGGPYGFRGRPLRSSRT